MGALTILSAAPSMVSSILFSTREKNPMSAPLNQMLRIKGIFTYHPIVPFYEARRTHAVLFSRRSHVLLCAKSSARTFPAFRGFLGRKGRAALPARQCSGMPAEERRRLGLGGSVRAAWWRGCGRRKSGGVPRKVCSATSRKKLARGAYACVTSSEIRRIAKSTSTTSIMGRTMALPFSVNCVEPM